MPKIKHHPRIQQFKDEPRVPQEEPHPKLVEINRISGLLDLIEELPELERVAELGSYCGVSTEVWAIAFPEVVAIDNWWVQGTYENFVKRIALYPNIRHFRLTTNEAVQLFPDGYFDLVYIDADHNYNAIVEDIKRWKPKLKSGGYLTGHDFSELVNYGHVIRAVKELHGEPQKVYKDSSWLIQLP